jgi:hypothetical protein
MKSKNQTAIAKVSPRGNSSQSPRGSQTEKTWKTAPSSPSVTAASPDRNRQPVNAEAIAARACLHYQNRAPADEDHLEDWFRAEAELACERD